MLRCRSSVCWDAGSGFGRIRWRVGFGRIRADSEQPRREIFAISQSVWAFRPYRNGFRIRTDSVESWIRTNSKTPNMEVGNPERLCSMTLVVGDDDAHQRGGAGRGGHQGKGLGFRVRVLGLGCGGHQGKS